MGYYSALILVFGGLAATVFGIYFLLGLKKQERFFESPHSLKKNFPELYDELKSFYNFDTLKYVKK